MITLLVIAAFVGLVLTSTRLGEKSSQQVVVVGIVVLALHYIAWVAEVGMDSSDVVWRQPIEAGLHVLAALAMVGFAIVLVRRAKDSDLHMSGLLVLAGIEVWFAVGALGAPYLERADVTVEQGIAKTADGRELLVGRAALEPVPQRIEITWRANGDLLDVRPLDPPRALPAAKAELPEGSYAETPARHGGEGVVVFTWILLGLGAIAALASFASAKRREAGGHIVAVVLVLAAAPFAWWMHGDGLRLVLSGERVSAVVTDRYTNTVRGAKGGIFIEHLVQARWLDADGAPHLAAGQVPERMWDALEVGAPVDVTVVRDAPQRHAIGRGAVGSLVLLVATMTGLLMILVAVWWINL